MEMDDFINVAKTVVAEYTNKDSHQVNAEDVYVVWQCKTLQNAKALLATPINDGMYFEATLNGDKKEIYFDAYKKEQNIVVEVK